ncbi:hypothetical protein KR51_00006110 [Rubidibacter lacunae KORDI 51-2]|uniref:Uncharacterized protein n=1 Tax=Rubidibacter lacunae KORDI 51-2 TaxID=582515 RepID=U5DP95_9CHRO|nr:hypothetical protein KR51_00006110 [Rubidibacter lacunae KORDI 51-2]
MVAGLIEDTVLLICAENIHTRLAERQLEFFRTQQGMASVACKGLQLDPVTG